MTKTLKKTLAIVVALALCLSAFMGCFSVSAADTDTITATVTGSTVTEGAEEVTVTIDIASTGFAAALLDISFGGLDIKADDDGEPAIAVTSTSDAGYDEVGGTWASKIVYQHNSFVDGVANVSAANDTNDGIRLIIDGTEEEYADAQLVLTFVTPAVGEYTVAISELEAADYGTYENNAWTDTEAIIETVTINQAEKNVVVNAAHVHEYSKVNYDETGHWTECTCGEKTEVVAHTMGDWADGARACTAECGYTETCEHTNATLKYSVVDGNCVTTKICPDCDNSEVVASVANLEVTPAANLSAGLAVNFRITKDQVNGTDVYGIINHDKYSDDNTISGTSDDVRVIPAATGTRYRFDYKSIASNEMLSTIHVKVFATDTNGNVILVTAYDFVLADYLKSEYIDNTSSPYRTLAADILRYGAESQKAFTYRVGVLPTEGVATDAFSELPTTFTNTDVIVGEGSTVTLEPSTVLGNTITLRFRFPVISGVDASDIHYTIAYKDATGTEKSYTSVDGEVGYNGNGKKYQFEFSDLPVVVINSYYTITVYNGDTVLGSLQYSFQNAANDYYNSEHAYKVLSQAICAYSTSAASLY